MLATPPKGRAAGSPAAHPTVMAPAASATTAAASTEAPAAEGQGKPLTLRGSEGLEEVRSPALREEREKSGIEKAGQKRGNEVRCERFVLQVVRPLEQPSPEGRRSSAKGGGGGRPNPRRS